MHRTRESEVERRVPELLELRDRGKMRPVGDQDCSASLFW